MSLRLISREEGYTGSKTESKNNWELESILNRYHNHKAFVGDKLSVISIESASSVVLSDNIGSAKYQQLDNTNMAQRHRDLPGPSNERRIKFLSRNKVKTMEQNEKRLKFISTHGSLTMRSFESGQVSDVEVTMKPFKDRSRSMSPLKQLKTYSFRSMPSEESILSGIQQELIRQSWQTINTKLELNEQNFGFFVYRRVFEHNPLLKRAFH
ncbi:unnamed protein product, partial [Wuchereria bancrofti]